MNQIPMNNPLAQIAQLIQSGRNPQSIMQIMLQNNPQAQQAMRMFSGKSTQQVEQMVRNMCAQRGITVEDLARLMGITIPSNR